MTDENKSPYHGLIPTVIFLCLPSVILTWLFYTAIMQYQPQHGSELNFASAKILGCGLGFLFHVSCWLMGAFKESAMIVWNRVKVFFEFITLSASSAFKLYFDDLMSNGAVLWIELAIIGANIWVAVDALCDFVSMRGWFF